MADTMLSFSNDALATRFLTKEEVFKKAPHAALTNPSNPNVSGRYVQATTSTIIDDLDKLGWYPVEAKQCRAKAGSKGIRSFHMIAFQNPNVAIANTDGGVECFPRIILTNSHDGFNSFKFMVGCFRTICSNGLVIATNQMVDISIRHMNYDFEELRQMVAQSLQQVGEQTKIIQTMRDTTLDKASQRDLAIKAIRLRSAVDVKVEDIEENTIEEVLSTKRDDDKGDSLWCVFNRIQENAMHGDYTMKSRTNHRMRKMRPIKSVVKDLSFNKGLFQAASEYLPLAA
ncbi:MAG: DUF945 domain-containing protein [bacterium]|nr:DUF945 domain-containing protein [bacterium]